MSATLDDLAAKVGELTLTVHRLTQVVQSRLAPPVDRLTLDEAAARLGRSASTFEKVVRRGLFTDPRPDKARGSKRLFLCDEIDAFAVDGPEGVRRLREFLGRD